MARTNVSTAQVRSWGRANLSLVAEAGHASLAPTARGRIHPEVVKAFRKANKTKGYAERVAEARTVAVPGVVLLDKAGRKTTRVVTIETTKARDLLGRPTNQRGRLPLRDLALAIEADSLA